MKWSLKAAHPQVPETSLLSQTSAGDCCLILYHDFSSWPHNVSGVFELFRPSYNWLQPGQLPQMVRLGICPYQLLKLRVK